MDKLMSENNVDKCIEFHFTQVDAYGLVKEGFTETSVNATKDLCCIDVTNPLTGDWRKWIYGISANNEAFTYLTSGGTKGEDN